MTIRISFKVEGLRECEEALAALPAALSLRTLEQALIKVAEPTAATARANAPKRTGELSTEIEVSVQLTPRQRSQQRKESAAEVYIGAGPVPQAHLQEFGTAHHAAQPFLRPAVDAHGQRMVSEFRTEIWAAILAAMVRFQRKAEQMAARFKGG